MSEKSKQITALNDALRRACRGPVWPIWGQAVITNGISVLPRPTVEAIIKKVTDFDDFTEDNDPHGEHDFGSFELDGHKVFWKVDYYEARSGLTLGAEHPESIATTERVLTIMLADEY